ncbi:MAG: CcdB family protein [Acinetobacter populi]|jgi:toxin CcdB|uniref:CcdB family protein n=1 Tax=Acinetobacter populi TaxID=1582270 RepID=UPI00235365F2|nr:CcdB family protein [Acinetobacter populi]MCH4247318.1 CcdB family protein [Acinetobacter populi]
MSQFTVYHNKNVTTKKNIPYLLDVQSGLLDELDTRVVIPLYAHIALKGKAFTRLTPIIEIGEEKYILMTPQLAGISKKELGSSVTVLDQHREVIVNALDFLISGI